MIISLITDIKSRRILNIVTLPAIIIGISYYTITSGFSGLTFSGLGFLVGFGLLLIPYMLGGMGAGDVKLMAAIGALMGTYFVFYSFLYTALIGGIISLILILKNRGIMNSLRFLYIGIPFLKSSLGSMTVNKDKNTSITFPYGVAIVVGTVSALIWGGF